MPRFEVLTQAEKFGPLRKSILNADSVDELHSICLERRDPIVSHRILDLPPNQDPLVRRRVGLGEMLMFYRQMEVNLRTGAGLTGALETAAQATQSKVLAGILRYARDRIVSDGSTLSDSLAQYPRTFSGVAMGLIRAGETAGKIDPAMAQMRVITRRNYSTVKRIKKLLRYPMIVLSVTVLAIGVILWKAVPQLKMFYGAFGAKLPSITQLLIDLSAIVTSYPLVCLAVAGGLGFGLFRLPRYLYSLPSTHRIALRIPLIGSLLTKIMQANFTRTYAQLRGVDVPLVRTLSLCRELDENIHYRGAISRAQIAVSEGNLLSDALAPEEDILSTIVVRTLKGEDLGGAPHELLKEVIVVQDEDIDDQLEALDAWSGPIMTIILAIIVGFVLIALALPLLTMSTIVNG